MKCVKKFTAKQGKKTHHSIFVMQPRQTSWRWWSSTWTGEVDRKNVKPTACAITCLHGLASAASIINQPTCTHSACWALVLKHPRKASPALIRQYTDCAEGWKRPEWKNHPVSLLFGGQHFWQGPCLLLDSSQGYTPSCFPSCLLPLVHLQDSLQTIHCLAPAVLGGVAASMHQESRGCFIILFNTASLPPGYPIPYTELTTGDLLLAEHW